MNVLTLSLQAPLSLALKGTTLPLQGPTAGPREAEVEGPRALWEVLKEAETDPMSYQIPPHPFYPSSDDKVIFFFFLVNCWKCFFFYSLFLRRACVAFSIKQICNLHWHHLFIWTSAYYVLTKVPNIPMQLENKCGNW